MILLGELRDSETYSPGVNGGRDRAFSAGDSAYRDAAGARWTAGRCVSRAGKGSVRSQLANCLSAVVAQKLQPDGEGRRVALFEMLGEYASRR